MNERPAAVAGIFYPDDPAVLGNQLDQLLDEAEPVEIIPKAIIVPHAGYIYSGAIAASAYRSLLPVADQITRVILLGPCHRVPVTGMAISGAEHFLTPLGSVKIDQQAAQQALTLPHVFVMDEAHSQEHSLEVQLPFLQRVLHDFQVLPVIVGETTADEVSDLLQLLWGGPETLIVISSDLSHYHNYDTARQLDQRTTHLIESLDYQQIHYDDACGRNPVKGLLHLAALQKLRVKTVDLRNSGDTAGSRDRVVGYGAYLLYS